MADNDCKVFIVEGEAREPLIINNISKVFFTHGNFEIITLPAARNIYMLWKKMKEDDFDIWREITGVFAMRISCLTGQAETITYEQYIKIIDPQEIQKLEKIEFQKERVFILSAFPEFLVDYFGRKLWKKCVRHTTNQLGKQECKRNY